MLISLCFGGLTSAKTVGADCVVSNCFADTAAKPTKITAEGDGAELHLLSDTTHANNQRNQQQQQQASDVKIRRVYHDVNEYQHAMDPSTPATMLNAANQANSRSGKLGSSREMLATKQAPSVTIYGAPNSSSGRFNVGPIAHQNAVYHQLPVTSSANNFYDDDFLQMPDHLSSGTPESEIRTASTFQR